MRDKDAQIIDIGCANGGLLKSLKDLGYNNLVGVDPSISCVENVKDQGIEATVGTLSNIPMHIGNFDCVILSHVLEHVSDLRDAISVITDHLEPKAESLAYVEVPDAAWYHEFVKSPFQDFNTEHINHFSYQSLSNLFSLNGWSVKGSGETEILAAEGIPYPVVYGFFTRDVTVKTFHKDNILKERIDLYIEKSTTIMAGLDAKIKSVLKKSDEVIVWGTGQLAMKLLAETSLGHAKIAAFVDSNPINQGKILRGIRIVSPDQIFALDYPIIVTTILHALEVKNTIKNHLKISNEIVLLQ
jgi:SAM-dependent methyltransferase